MTDLSFGNDLEPKAMLNASASENVTLERAVKMHNCPFLVFFSHWNKCLVTTQLLYEKAFNDVRGSSFTVVLDKHY